VHGTGALDQDTGSLAIKEVQGTGTLAIDQGHQNR
jgi:hypothetical protein